MAAWEFPVWIKAEWFFTIPRGVVCRITRWAFLELLFSAIFVAFSSMEQTPNAPQLAPLTALFEILASAAARHGSKIFGSCLETL